jgi:hypothetical protein
MVVGTLGRLVLPVLLGIAFLLAGIVFAAQQEKKSSTESQLKINHKKAFALYRQKCLQCHDSVADPEKPGRTKDDWLLVLKVMHGYGLDLTPKETEQIGGFLYDLRKGMEKEAG